VDLPGYGFAKAPKSMRAQWSRMMQGYLRTRGQLVAMVQLVDSRHEPSREDREMVQWLVDEQHPFCLVATKMDKLRQSERQPALRTIMKTLELPATQPLVPYSSQTGEGREDLLAWIAGTIAATSGR
jgi:GTP-binding protein